MKHLTLIVFIVNFNFYSYGQCEVDAGDDIYICVDQFGVLDTANLNAEIINGLPPFEVKWEAGHLSGLISIPIFTASYFLDDTTSLTARITDTQNVENNDPLPFYITIADGNGDKCMDSTNVVFSMFSLVPGLPNTEINQGDSIQLFPLVGNGIPPLSYSWFPDYNISDTNATSPKVWPDVTTEYDVVIIDAANCQSNWEGTGWEIKVIPVNTEYIWNKNEQMVYPNPTNGFIKFKNRNRFILYNILGKKLKEGEGTRIDISELAAGKYLLRLEGQIFKVIKQ